MRFGTNTDGGRASRRRAYGLVALLVFSVPLGCPLEAQGPVDPATGLPIEEWLPWEVARRLLAIEGFTLPSGETEFRSGLLFDGMEAYLPERHRVAASLKWDSGDLVLFDTDGPVEALLDELIDRGSANGFQLAIGVDWGFAENPMTFPLAFCHPDGPSLTITGNDGAEDGAQLETLELSALLRPSATRACRASAASAGREKSESKMPLPVLYAPRGVRIQASSSSSSGLADRTKNQTLTAPEHDVIYLLRGFALQMEQQGWFASPETDFGGAAAQMFTQYAESPDDDSIAGWLALIVLSRIDLDTGQVSAQLSIRRVVQKTP